MVARPGHPGRDLPGRPAVGAVAAVKLADGRTVTGRVDGGTGHSGRRSPDIHLGLGEIAAGAKLNVELRWRDHTGEPHESTVSLTPGWHTVRLGAAPKQVAGHQP
jgi:hypothetical protein